MSALHDWARTMSPEDDVLVTWTWLLTTYGVDAVEADPIVGPMIPMINGATALRLALLSLSRTVEAIVEEHRATDPDCIRRWGRS